MFPICSSTAVSTTDKHFIPDDKMLALSNLKAFAINNFVVTTQILLLLFDDVENIVGKGEMLVTSNFCFPNHIFKRLKQLTLSFTG